MGHTFTRHLYHVVFSTRRRERWLEPSSRQRLFEYMVGIARKTGANVSAVGGTDDHVHLLVMIPPALAMSDFVRTLKANSSRWLRRTGPRLDGFAWQAGYSSFTVSGSVAPQVKAYVESQEEHHRRWDFAEELAKLLARHGIEFDPAHYLD